MKFPNRKSLNVSFAAIHIIQGLLLLSPVSLYKLNSSTLNKVFMLKRKLLSESPVSRLKEAFSQLSSSFC